MQQDNTLTNLLKTGFDWLITPKPISPLGLMGGFVFLGLAFTSFANFNQSPKHAVLQVATVDAVDLMRQFAKEEANSHLPADAIQSDTAHFVAKLQIGLKEVSDKHHVVLVPAEAVLIGAPDYTAQVAQAVGLNKGQAAKS
jgi:hypothetical protein